MEKKNIKGDGDIIIPSFKMKSSGVSVTAIHPDGSEQINYYSGEVSTERIASDSTNVSAIDLIPEQKIEFMEAIDYAKTHKPYTSDFEIALNFKEGFKFRIKREPRKTIRWISGRKK